MYFKGFSSHRVESTDGRTLTSYVNFDPSQDQSGRPLIALNNGLICKYAWWHYLAPYLTHAGFNIIAHEYRGHFDNNFDEDKAAGKITFKTFAGDLRQILRSLNMDKAIIIGHSMGVNVSLEFMRTHPEMVRGLVLISGSMFPPTDSLFNTSLARPLLYGLAELNRKNPRTFNHLWREGSLTPISKTLVHFFGTNIKTTPYTIITKYVEDLAQLPPELFFTLLEEMDRHDIVRTGPDINLPTLILGGTHDPLCPLPLVQRMNKVIRNSELRIIEGARHVPQVEYPQMVYRHIMKFLIQNQLNEA